MSDIERQRLDEAIALVEYMAQDDSPETLRRFCKRVMQIAHGEETVHSLAQQAEQEEKELRKKHPIMMWLYDRFHPADL
jgi:hypothetical protein